MSILMHQQINAWLPGLICLDAVLLALGITIQHLFPEKEKLVIIIPGLLCAILCFIGIDGLHSNWHMQTIYVLCCIDAGIVDFLIGAVICKNIQRFRMWRKKRHN